MSGLVDLAVSSRLHAAANSLADFRRNRARLDLTQGRVEIRAIDSNHPIFSSKGSTMTAKFYPDITKDISAHSKTLRRDIPEVMAGFSAMAQAATKDGA
ncbi:MAG: hypothetical protein LDL42_16515, partial [Rhizobium sp.]|nr:hypothetical protein [Rhizobium sp.]